MAARKAARVGKKLPRGRKEKNIVDVENITLGSGMTPPPLLKESKYPWDQLANKPYSEGAKDAAHFSVGFENKEDAVAARTSIFTSGRNYYQNRNMELIPVVRVMKGDEGEWSVIAFARLEEGEE